MNIHIYFSPLPSSLPIIPIFILIVLPIAYSDDNGQFLECNETFSCGIIPGIQYPFWGSVRPRYCGHGGFELICEENQFPVININAQRFRVLNVSIPGTMSIAPVDIWEDSCPEQFHNITLDHNLFDFAATFRNLSIFYGCPLDDDIPSQHRFSCTTFNGNNYAYYLDESLLRIHSSELTDCNISIRFPVNGNEFDELWSGNDTIEDAWNKGFDVVYHKDIMECMACRNSGGVCGSDNTTLEFLCFCHDQPHPQFCLASGRGINWRAKLGIGFGAAFGGIIITCIGFFCWLRRRQGKVFFKSSFVSGKSSSDFSVMMDAEKGDSLAGVHLFSYEELQKATNKFDSDRELGEGGFGTVYYGKLRDGRVVAVKRLYENNYRRVEQFMNEVEILTRLRHKNLVSLYGCTSRHSRELLLVYEYIPNGTVADHLHGERAKPGALPWSIRLEIAIETAEALRFLHASDTIHRDVKTNNILLDNNFSVKVADFGLSRLFPTDVTHVSTAPQGTPGYVDPEYHQCYQLTDKSDVFSFGVVLVELISSKPAVDITRHRHEINLSNMAINKIQNRALHELIDPSLGFESDYKVRKMITGVAEVAFQCLQNVKDMRPTMEEVLEALVGIQNEDYNKEKAEDMDISADEVGLLKSGPVPLSPDSVMIKWISGSSTTPSISN
ncbi:LEAF RUST 10 DISEASE-RESISTANCE LOCUS RECEPTOR-LIKE PROTEIN KINASE-like 1.2 isoform X1 [Herrania umbratica]|uniref:non-specific serine/threonine protein kinase n=1 Tax=Herrania umbratica TaxID=108875 RepID=A0A6J1AZZ8_9ROSI|nr:LEAF RUST 10 DISEASE-RESISTANCE LOCUS RECEPTOR-LIKE PROTEIN KINASE-like 1.2 isoform X1 [Herrania umbratica]